MAKRTRKELRGPKIVSVPPGPKSKAAMVRKEKFITNAVKVALPIDVTFAEGPFVQDADGNVYVDLGGGIGVQTAGHRPPSVIRAAKDELDRLTHISFMVATYGPYTDPHGLPPAECAKAPVEEIERAITQTEVAGRVAAILAEPVQGEGGMIVPPKEFFPLLRKLCDAHGIVLVDDEVQAGMGRTGKLWAIENWNTVPDILVSGKAVGGGLPFGGVTGKPAVMDRPGPGSLGGTFGGNPVVCAAALEAIDEIQKALPKTKRLESLIRKRLDEIFEGHERVGEVRGIGAMWALEFVKHRETKEPDVELARAVQLAGLKNGLVLARVPLSTKEDVDVAVQEALRAWDLWRETPPLDRARYFFTLRDLMEQHFEDLSRVVVQDMGKTIDEARGEVRRAIENVEVASGIPSLMMGYNLEDGAGKGIDEEVLYQPLGVFAGISPFSFHVMVQFWFWPYAVATGNCWIAKPSEQDPTAMQLVMDLVHQAGFPAGVVNLVHGAKETVTAMLDHPQIVGVSFVGSSAVAELIYAKAAASGKRVQAGGGAKNVLVVMPDAKLDKVVSNLVSSCYGCAGERCLAGSVVVGVGEVHADLRRKFSDAAASLKVGYGLDEAGQMGPGISSAHRDRVVGFIDRGEQEGAEGALDGRSIRGARYDRYLVGPTGLHALQPEISRAPEENFGPVASVLPVDVFEDAVDLINKSPYGNAATIYTSSGKHARDFRYRVHAGNIGINVGVAAPMAYFPFGGMKNSFFGDLHPQSRDAIRFFTESKVVITRWP